MEPILLYFTFPDMDTARGIAKALLEERLIACANILPQATSLYRWEGELREAPEIVMFAKTLSSHEERIIKKVRTLHPYDCPCIISTPIESGHEDYLEWLEDEVAG